MIALETLRKTQLPAPIAEPGAELNLIFRLDTGLPLKQRRVKREFRKLLMAAGIRPIRFYSLRHTAASLAAAAGVSAKVISDQLGHASILLTLERYTHVLPGIQDEAAARVERMLMGPPVHAIREESFQPDQNPQPSDYVPNDQAQRVGK